MEDPVMTKLEKFQLLNPKITKIKIVREGDDILGWELFNDSEKAGYGFNMKVPDQAFDIPDTEEFDVYEVTGVIDTEFKIDGLDIVLHEDFKGTLWAEDIIEAAYRDQYTGLAAEQIQISPAGAIDAISGSTISSNAVTAAIREKLMKFEGVFK
jgi:hypothetical protein